MSLESPPRLKQGELGRILEAADAPVSPERIAANQDAIKAAIAAGVARSIPLWIKIVLPLLLCAGGYAVYRGLSREAPRDPASAITAIAPDAQPDAELDAVEPDAPDDAASSDAPIRDDRTAHAHATPVDAAPDAAPTSDLPEQIALYEQARTATDPARGIELVDELLRRFPATQLRADAELTRAELLTRANRLDDAAAALETLAASAEHRGRRGELLRALGDVRRKQGDCVRAIEAYTHAREMKLNAAETAKVDRGVERCQKP